MKSDFLRLIPAALFFIYATYGTWFLIKEIFTSYVPFTLVSTGIIVGFIAIFRVPPPDRLAVETILGKELNQEAGENGFTIKTVAHRGAGLDAPENTLEAFTRCHEKGCDVIEFDVSLTSDGVPIIFHDTTTERMADSNVVVKHTAWEELSKIDVSIKHAYRDSFPDANIPTLDQAVEHILSLGQRMFIDVKDPSNKMISVILKLYKKYPELHSKAVVTSFFPNIIYWIRRSSPEIVCCLASKRNIFNDMILRCPEGCRPNRVLWMLQSYLVIAFEIIHNWALPRITYYLLGISVILLHKDNICRDTISMWNSLGVRVIAWTINSPIEKQHMTRNLQITYLTDTLTGENTIHNLQSS
ncbi:unnamed protein product [Psylliodes chrysocephalus]|uniref:GP-PDE domain-containing protein n=1 Tax=Psylliodes chrysocephalus TaxID=3402493 RepID=A0A9P0CU00_9CUCU|nr:unnamed protein product [Psylliodes chrysocephala]